MTHSTRYDKLKNKLQNDFQRATTLAPALSAGEQKTLIALNDHNDSYSITERFQKYGPFNAVYVQNFSSYDVRLYLTESREVYVDIPASTGTGVAALQKVPLRYIDYLRIENLNGSNAISAGDVTIQVGNEVDSEELTLLEMSGLLNV